MFDALRMGRKLVDRMTEIVRLKFFSAQAGIRREITKAIFVEQVSRLESDLTRLLNGMFRDQVSSMVRELNEIDPESKLFALAERIRCSGYPWEIFSKLVSPTAANLAQTIFNPSEWDDELVDRTLPVLARAMAEAMVAQLMEFGVDVRRKRGKSVKETTASRWLADHDADAELLAELLTDADVPLGVLTEVPLWMQEEIAGQLREVYDQPFWREINETTLGDASRVLDQGLRDGQSITRMATEMAASFQGSTAKYAKMRATRIARTESGNALNGARKAAQDKVAEVMGPEVPMRASWISVLGNTTRDAHAGLDGVPADENGMWNLNGVMVPWPGHFSLPPSDRVNCLCTSGVEFGMNEDEARRLIQESEERLL